MNDDNEQRRRQSIMQQHASPAFQSDNQFHYAGSHLALKPSYAVLRDNPLLPDYLTSFPGQSSQTQSTQGSLTTNTQQHLQFQHASHSTQSQSPAAHSASQISNTPFPDNYEYPPSSMSSSLASFFPSNWPRTGKHDTPSSSQLSGTPLPSTSSTQATSLNLGASAAAFVHSQSQHREPRVLDAMKGVVALVIDQSQKQDEARRQQSEFQNICKEAIKTKPSDESRLLGATGMSSNHCARSETPADAWYERLGLPLCD